ncbi:MAG: signal peptidase II [Spirochaetaceae bacterium]|nr:signal peptidase II [Spirochaetaceae bacterium]
MKDVEQNDLENKPVTDVRQFLKIKLLPLVLTVVVFVLDQGTKLAIVKTIPPYTIGASFFGDFLRIIHVYNPGIAFSMGNSLPDTLRGLLFAIIPLIVLLVVLGIYFRNDDFTFFQRWTVAGIIGGGLGNIYDRFFRPEGVVDFIDVKFYGLFGLERWPTFNVADAAVLICGFLLIISFIRAMIQESKAQKSQ